MEEWRKIEGYEGLYQVSNLGRVKSLMYGKEKILKGGINPYGYHFVILNKYPIKKNMKVHRLVAKAFIPNSDNKPEVNHIDGNKLNNNIHNLEWNTRKENNSHALDTGLTDIKGEKHYKVKLTEEQVLDIRVSNLTKVELAKIYNVTHQNISAIINKKSWKHI